MSFFYRCYRERGQREGEGAGEETGRDGNNNFVALSGVPEWVTTPRLLLMHYYFNSMYSLVGATTARRWFPFLDPSGTDILILGADEGDAPWLHWAEPARDEKLRRQEQSSVI